MSREIRDEMKKLSKADKAVISKMMSYLYTRSINQFELNNMQAEIVGMAAEGALRGEKLETVCGPDYKKFCDELSANCLHKSKIELFLEVVMILSLTFAILLPFIYFSERFLGDPGKVNGFLLSFEAGKLFGFLLVPAFCGGFGILIYQRNSFARKGKALLVYSLFYIVTYFILRVVSEMIFHGEITINVLIPAIVTVAAFLLSFLTKRAIASARMKEKELV